jgi:hypothetical protein
VGVNEVKCTPCGGMLVVIFNGDKLGNGLCSQCDECESGADGGE